MQKNNPIQYCFVIFSYNADNTEPNKYSGYVYDAVWLYALALDKLIRDEENKHLIISTH
jgi:hypothetical protein